jgi:hypothetical protein
MNDSSVHHMLEEARRSYSPRATDNQESGIFAVASQAKMQGGDGPGVPHSEAILRASIPTRQLRAVLAAFMSLRRADLALDSGFISPDFDNGARASRPSTSRPPPDQ